MKFVLPGKMRSLILILFSFLYFSSTIGDELDAKIDSIFAKPSSTATTPSSEPETFVNNISTASPSESTTISQDTRNAVNNIFEIPSSADPPSTETSSSVESTDCVCVPFYLCSNGTVNINGSGLLDIRISDNSCSNKEHFCCKSPITTSEPVSITEVTTSRKPSGCGYGKPNVIGDRIMGGEEAVSTFAEFPWMVAIVVEPLMENFDKVTVYQCGGALIHPQAVLTAAHCVVDKVQKFKVRAGELNTQNTDEPLPHQERYVDSITLHPRYYAAAQYNDVAVLILEQPFEIADNVNVICLPEQNYTTTDTRCYLTGWGKDGYGKKGKYQGLLKKLDLPVVERDSCQNRLRKTRAGHHFHLHRSFMCAGGEEGKDACTGDGGSPLVCPIPDQENRFYHAGIVSWGIGCGDDKIPGVYANVASFRDWIDEQIRHHNLNSSSYKY